MTIKKENNLLELNERWLEITIEFEIDEEDESIVVEVDITEREWCWSTIFENQKSVDQDEILQKTCRDDDDNDEV